MPISSTKTLIHSCVIFVVITMFTSTFAAPAPPGVPKRSICAKALQAGLITNLTFGDFDGSTAGTVTITPSASGATRSSSGLNFIGGTFNAAQFNVSNATAGCEYYPVRIQIQGVPTTLTGAGTAMPADIFTTYPAGTFTLGPGGSSIVSVGATLTSNPAQAGGAYTTGVPFTLRFSHVNP